MTDKTKNIYSFAEAKDNRDKAHPINRYGKASPEFLATLDWQTIEVDLPPDIAEMLGTFGRVTP